MRRHVLLVLLAFSAAALWASAKDLTVTVIDQDLGTPLEGVRLSVRGVEGTFKTGADGKTTIGLPAETTPLWSQRSFPDMRRRRPSSRKATRPS